MRKRAEASLARPIITIMKMAVYLPDELLILNAFLGVGGGGGGRVRKLHITLATPEEKNLSGIDK